MDEMVDQYNAGWSLHQIADYFGCSRYLVRNRLQQKGITIRGIHQSMITYYAQGNHPSNWRGGRYSHSGYTLIIDPKCSRVGKDGYCREHISVWEKVHNQPLPRNQIIHHLNGIKSDNRPENLIAMKQGEHINQTMPYKKRIRELEVKITLLEQALNNQRLQYSDN